VAVDDGYFIVTLDFGQRFATTQGRFLEIEVRRDTGLACGNLTGFATLTPRQPITAAPMATHARSAFSLDASDGNPLGAVTVDSEGRVGIGTPAPTHTVHVAGPAPTLALQDNDANPTQVGYVSYRNADNTETAWVGYGTPGSPHFSIVNARPSGNIALLPFAGNVGIGTSTPTAKLEVHGDIRLGSSGQFNAAAGTENLRLVRGDIDGNGTRLRGSGFVVSRVAEGFYDITFTPAFSGIPTIVASVDTPIHSSGRWAYHVESLATPGFARIVINTESSFTDSDFSICVIGPR
jgi:hypothetical protein